MTQESHLSPTGRMMTHRPEFKSILLERDEPTGPFPEFKSSVVSCDETFTPPEANERKTFEGHPLYEGELTRVIWDEDDGDLYITQKQCSTSPTIKFGPLTTTLKHLMVEEHYWLDCRVSRRMRWQYTPSQIRIYLTNGILRYKIGTTSWEDMQMCARIGGQYDLGDHVKMDVNLVQMCSSMPVTIEKIIERDPFEMIQEKYGKPKNPAIHGNVPLLGSNLTLREEVRFQLTGKTPDQL